MEKVIEENREKIILEIKNSYCNGNPMDENRELCFSQALSLLTILAQLENEQEAQKLTELILMNETSYHLLIDRIDFLKEILIDCLNAQSNEFWLKAWNAHMNLKRKVSFLYLQTYSEKITKRNEIRLKELDDFSSASHISGLREHIVWFNQMAQAIKFQQSFEAPAYTECGFGKWLENFGKKNMSAKKYEKIKKLHFEIHEEAQKLLFCAENKKGGDLKRAVLKNIEFVSFALETEITQVRNSEIENAAVKDFMVF